MPLRVRTHLALESILKGVFVGLCYPLVLRVAEPGEVAGVAGWMAALLAGSLAAAWYSKARSAAKPSGQWLAWLVLLFLDHSLAVYGGVLAGLAIGSLQVGLPPLWVAGGALGGAILGLGLIGAKRLRRRWLKWVVAAALLALGALWLWPGLLAPWLAPVGSGWVLTGALLLAVAGFLLLSLAGQSEQTEVEVAIVCVGLALALGQLELPMMLQRIVVLAPLALFVIYCERVRRHLVVFKHVIRGLSYEQQPALRQALVCYRMALDVHPRSEAAMAGNWRVHRKLDLAGLAEDPEMVSMIDPVMCLERARTLLGQNPVAAARRTEIAKLLEIVAFRRPDLPQTIGHESTRLLLAGDDIDAALERIEALTALEPARAAALPDHEADALYRTWLLALQAPPLLAQNSLRLVENEGLFRAISVMERRLRQAPRDETARSFKALLYEKVPLEGYNRHVERSPDDLMGWFDCGYCGQLATELAEAQPDRAIEFLQIAEHGLPEQRLVLWHSLARLYDGRDTAEADRWRGRIKEFARGLGLSRLSEPQRAAYFETVRVLAERAQAVGDVAAAIENFQLYCESPKAGTATLRTLQQLFEAHGERVLALRPVEAALAYSLSDADRRQWLQAKSRLYAEVSPSEVQSRLGEVERFFDFSYCYRRALKLFNENAPADEVIHYLDLAALGGSRLLLNVNYLLGRTYLRAEDVASAVLCLEQVRANRPKKFADNEQEEAYFTACRLLGDLYLEKLAEPAKAVDCFDAYRAYLKSGADTLYKLARSYELAEQPAHARKWYDMVLVYPNHPKAAAAREALARLQPAVK